MTIPAAVEAQRTESRVIETGHAATTDGEPLVVVHVLRTGDFEAYEASSFEAIAIEDERTSTRETTSEIVTVALDVVDTRGRIGDPAAEIPVEAVEIGSRFVVFGRRRRSPVGKAIFEHEAVGAIVSQLAGRSGDDGARIGSRATRRVLAGRDTPDSRDGEQQEVVCTRAEPDGGDERE